jgi:hypothetical protein
VVRVHVRVPIFIHRFTEHVRLDEEAALNPAVPHRGIRGASPWCSAFLLFTPDSLKVERPAHIRQAEERYLVGRPTLFLHHPSVAQ